MKKMCIFLSITLWLMLCGFTPGTDYMALMVEAAATGDAEAGYAAEAARDTKIDELGLDEPKVDYDELVLLAQLIHTEAGSDWLPMDWKVAVGEVVLNRVASPEFPDTIREVVFQPGQYSAADEAWFKTLMPYSSCVEAAKRVLTGERVLNDPSVVYQSGTRQGSGTHMTFTDDIYGTTYFCYSSRPELYEED